MNAPNLCAGCGQWPQNCTCGENLRWINPTDETPPPQAGGEVQGQAGQEPCPFCGSSDIETGNGSYECRNCGAMGPCEPMARPEHWNQRASSLSARGGREGVGIESIEETHARHKRIAESNEGRLGMPTGPCQCEICSADLVEKGKHNHK